MASRTLTGRCARPWHVISALTCLLAACGGNNNSPGTVTTGGREDAGHDSGPTEKPDAGKPQPKDAGTKPAADSGTTMSKDAGVDSGAKAPIDAGPGDVGIDAGPAPATWTCAKALWADGYCDCGCGVADFDCTGQSCTESGCISPSCDACYTSAGAWKPCTTPPDVSAWTCGMDALATGDPNCDCGCGYPDPVCGASGCIEPGCWRAKCNVRHDGSGAVLNDMVPPFNGWTCIATAWGGGDGCDCGCGAVDPDCKSSQTCTAPACNASECKTCHDKTGRTVPCDNALHDWTCDPQRYGSGDGCDCGCGVPDPDCADKGCKDYGCRDAACKRCTDTNFANDRLVGCTPSDAWKCDASHYGTGDGCDCGCGAHDPDCPAGPDCTGKDCQDVSCEYCHNGDGTENDYVICDPPGDTKGWTCGTVDDPAWKNAECDCGCGRPDPYCRLTQRASCTDSGCKTATCQFCNTDGQARAACAAPHWSTDGTCKLALYAGDGKCDCGCGAIDPDCDQGDGCTASQCAGKGCDICHGPGSLLATCYDWKCPANAYGDGKTCDCGCGAPDPDCSGYGCIEPGCHDAMCSPDACHDPFGRTVTCP
jgi:hypothetical protein